MIDDRQVKENLLNSMSKLNEQINKLRDELNAGKLKVNVQIRDIITLITKVRDLKKDVIFSPEENTEFENKFNTLKLEFKRLKSRHIEKYNEKIGMINRRFKPFLQKLLDRNLDDKIKAEIKLVPILKKVSILAENKDWRHNSYLDKLEYDKIELVEVMISQLENNLEIKNIDTTDEMQVIVDEVSEVLKIMEQKVDGELTIEENDKYLFECGTLLGRVLTLNTEHEKLRDKISTIAFSDFSNKIVNLQIRLDNVRQKLSRNKQMVNINNIYTTLIDELSVLEANYTELVEMFFETENKCTEYMVSVYKNFLKKFNKRFGDIVIRVQNSFNDGKINQQQLTNLNERMSTIIGIHTELKEKLDNEPVLKNGKKLDDDFFLSIENDLATLKKNILCLGDGPVRDKGKRKNVEELINELNNSLEGLNTMLLRYSKIDNKTYEILKSKYNDYKNELEELNNSYSAKCPLVVRTIREAKPLYKKHKKLGLVSAGLASIALITSNYTLIPALMHGNAMLGGAVPVFKGMMGFFNKVLGSMIGASLGQNGAWVLATGTVLNGTVAVTSILKSLATIGVGAAALTAPLYVPQIISKVKELVEKIKAYDLKQKLSNTYQSGVKKLNQTVGKNESKVDKKDLKAYYDNLYVQYTSYNNGMSLSDFCKKNNLTSGDREVLSAMITKGKLEEKIKKVVGEQVNSKRKAKTA